MRDEGKEEMQIHQELKRGGERRGERREEERGERMEERGDRWKREGERVEVGERKRDMIPVNLYSHIYH